MSAENRTEDPEDGDGNMTPGGEPGATGDRSDDPGAGDAGGEIGEVGLPAGGAGRSERRQRLRRNAVLGLAVALGAAGIAVLSVFIYSLFDEDELGDGWFAYEMVSRPVHHSDDGGGEGYEPGKDQPSGGDGRPHRSAATRDSRDAAVRSGHGDDGIDGDDGGGLAGGPSGCVELQSFESKALLLCDRESAGAEGFDELKDGRRKRPRATGRSGDPPRGWVPWDAEPGYGQGGSGRWAPDRGPLDPLALLALLEEFPFEDFDGPAPWAQPRISPWERPPGDGTEFGFEPPTPPDTYGGPSWMSGGKPCGDGSAWEFGGSILPELFDAWLGELLGWIPRALFEGFRDGSGVPEAGFDPQALDGSIPPELFEGMLGSILGDLFDDLDLEGFDPDGLGFGFDPDALDLDEFDLEGLGDLIPGELFGELFGLVLEGADLGDLNPEAPEVLPADEPDVPPGDEPDVPPADEPDTT